MEKRIPVIIPAYEPDEKMIRLLQTLQESGIERIVVVDDGSGNEYRNLFEQAKQLGAIVLTHAVNLGKGRALKTAFNEVLNRYPEAIGAITADSDGQHTPACIQKCMEAMEKEPEKLILGAGISIRTTSRQNRNGATKSHVRCSNTFAAWRYRIPRPGCAAFRLRLCAI